MCQAFQVALLESLSALALGSATVKEGGAAGEGADRCGNAAVTVPGCGIANHLSRKTEKIRKRSGDFILPFVDATK